MEKINDKKTQLSEIQIKKIKDEKLKIISKNVILTK